MLTLDELEAIQADCIADDIDIELEVMQHWTEEQVIAFFQGLELPKGVGGVHLVLGANGRPNGEAFVECGSEETAEAQLV